MNSSHQSLFSPSNGLPSGMGKQDEMNMGMPNNRHLLSNTMSASPRSSPIPSERRSSEAGALNIAIGTPGSSSNDGPNQAPRFNVSVFRSPFNEDNQEPIHRALDPIAPDQRDPFNNIDSPSISAHPPLFRNMQGERPYPPLEHTNSRERSVSVQLDSLDDSPVPPGMLPVSIFRQGSFSGISPFSLQRHNSLTPRHSVSQDNYVSSNLSGPPVTINTGPIMHDNVLASSPVSSISAPSASSAIAGSTDKIFEAQVKSSPLLQEILDRVQRT
ncbi:hypothetical protein FRC15_008217, partial [Serendipita sp. 397]